MVGFVLVSYSELLKDARESTLKDITSDALWSLSYFIVIMAGSATMFPLDLVHVSVVLILQFSTFASSTVLVYLKWNNTNGEALLLSIWCQQLPDDSAESDPPSGASFR